MNIVIWFDKENKEHLEAFYYYQINSSWPEGFKIPDNIIYTNAWQYMIQGILAAAYISEKLERDLKWI